MGSSVRFSKSAFFLNQSLLVQHMLINGTDLPDLSINKKAVQEKAKKRMANIFAKWLQNTKFLKIPMVKKAKHFYKKIYIAFC
jgi:hypothetical protein